MRDPRGGRMLQGLGAVLGGKSVPACWEDNQSLWDPLGGMYYYIVTRHPEFYTLAASKQGLFGVAKAVATGPVGPVPLAVGAYYLTRPTKTAAAVGGTRTTKKRKAKGTRKMNGLKLHQRR